MTPTELTNFLNEQIPLARALAIQIVSTGDDQVEVLAPLAPNSNHMGTAFGGSLGAVLILSCYTWLFHRLDQDGFSAHVLIKEGKTDYLLPVESDLRAICLSPEISEIEKFTESFKRKGRGKITLKAHILQGSEKACVFEGIFVAQKSSEPQLG
jgi:thioesterase domain-containing protein